MVKYKQWSLPKNDTKISNSFGSKICHAYYIFKCSYEVLWLSKINILIFSNRGKLGLSKIIIILFFWLLIKEKLLSEFGHLSYIRRKSRVTRCKNTIKIWEIWTIFSEKGQYLKMCLYEHHTLSSKPWLSVM